jgi:hypothetical protein
MPGMATAAMAGQRAETKEISYSGKILVSSWVSTRDKDTRSHGSLLPLTFLLFLYAIYL